MQFCIEFLRENIKPSTRRKAVILPFKKHKHFSLVICRLLESNWIHFLMQSAVIDPNGFLVLFWVRWIATFADFRIISVISQLIVRWYFKSIDFGIPSEHMEKNFASSLRLVCKTERNIFTVVTRKVWVYYATRPKPLSFFSVPLPSRIYYRALFYLLNVWNR